MNPFELAAPILIVGGIFAALIAAIVFSNQMRKKSIAEWTAYAQEMGWTLSGGYPGWRLEGTLDGVSIWVEHTTHRGSKGQIHYTAHVAAMARGAIGDLNVTPEGFLDRVFGAGDAKIGDETFDRRFVVKCSDMGFVERGLTQEVKQILLGSEAGGIQIADGAFRFTRGGALNLMELKRVAPILVRLSLATR